MSARSKESWRRLRGIVRGRGMPQLRPRGDPSQACRHGRLLSGELLRKPTRSDELDLYAEASGIGAEPVGTGLVGTSSISAAATAVSCLRLASRAGIVAGVERNPPASVQNDVPVVSSLDELGDWPLLIA